MSNQDDAFSEKVKLLAKTPLFKGLKSHDIEELAARTHERHMRANEVLFRRDDAGASMLAILAGNVRIVLSGVDGRDQVLRLLGPGEVFGEIALLDGGARTADAVAETNGRLLVLERRYLLQGFRKNEDFAVQIIALLCNRLRSTNWLLETMLFQDTSQRLASTILSLSRTRPGHRIDMTQRALGAIAAAARETVNKKLREWQEAGFIILEPGRITVIDPGSLDRSAASGTAELF